MEYVRAGQFLTNAFAGHRLAADDAYVDGLQLLRRGVRIPAAVGEPCEGGDCGGIKHGRHGGYSQLVHVPDGTAGQDYVSQGLLE